MKLTRNKYGYCAVADALPNEEFQVFIYKIDSLFFIADCQAKIEATRKTIKLHPTYRKEWRNLRSCKADIEEMFADVRHEQAVRKEALHKYGPKGLKNFYKFRKTFFEE